MKTPDTVTFDELADAAAAAGAKADKQARAARIEPAGLDGRTKAARSSSGALPDSKVVPASPAAPKHERN